MEKAWKAEKSTMQMKPSLSNRFSANTLLLSWTKRLEKRLFIQSLVEFGCCWEGVALQLKKSVGVGEVTEPTTGLPAFHWNKEGRTEEQGYVGDTSEDCCA